MKLTREEKLLLECLARETDCSLADTLTGLEESDWEGLLEQSKKHWVTPLVYKRLKGVCSKVEVPSGVMEKMRRTYLHVAARNARILATLSGILRAINAAGIPVIVLKGAHLVEVVYRDLGLRSMGDVDLLFKKEHLPRVQRILAGSNTAYSSAIDVHWDIDLSLTSCKTNIREIWARAREEIIADQQVKVLSPEDLLLHQCLHLSLHHFYQHGGLRTLCDITEILRYYDDQLNWDRIEREAREWGAANSIYITLRVAKELLNARVPEFALRNLRPNENDEHIKEWAVDQIFRAQKDTLKISPFFWRLWEPGTFQEKISCIKQLLFPAPEYVTQEYSGAYHTTENLFCYLVRVKTQFVKYARVLWKLLLRDEEIVNAMKRMNRDIRMREWMVGR